MSIKRKIILAMVGATLVTVLAGWAAVRHIGQEGFLRIDQERAAADMARAVTALNDELQHMDSALVFRSSSDITYRFAAGRDKSLAAGFFSFEALRAADLNLTVLFDPAGEPIAGAAFDLSTREEIPLPGLLEGLPRRIRQQKTGDPEAGAGLVLTPSGPMFVCFRPVLNSMGWGPSRGTFLDGRFVDKAMVGGIAHRLSLDLSLEPLSQVPPKLVRTVLEAVTSGENAALGAVTPESLTMHAVYPDFLGRPALLLTLKHPRARVFPFRQTVTLALLFVGAAGMCAFAAAIFLLRRSVLAPLDSITRHIRTIRDARDLRAPLALDRDDEIGLLAKAFDSMGEDICGLYDQLDRQHGLLRQLIDAIPHPISLKDGRGRYLAANSALAGLLGRPVSSIPGLTDAGLGAPLAWSAHARLLETAVLESGESRFTPAEPLDLPGEETRFFDTTRILLPGPGGSGGPGGPGEQDGQVLTIGLDVTERLRAEECLRLSERRYRSLFESTTEGVCVHEYVHGVDGRITDYRIVDVNAAFERILGIPRETAVGKLASELYGTGEAPFLDIYVRVGETGLPQTFDPYFEPLDKHFHVSAFSPYPGVFASVFEDTTERIRTQAALEEARSTIRHILDSMPSPVIGVDSAGRIAHMNAAASAFCTGRSCCTIGGTLFEAFPQLAGQRGAIQAAMDEGRPEVVRKLSLRLGIEEKLMDLEIFPMVREGRTQGAVLRLDDVTERVRMEEVLLQSEKMMSVGGLAAGMAHEINNPLGGILQCVQIIRRRLEPDLPGNLRAARDIGCSLDAVNAYLKGREILHFLDSIHDAGSRAARIVANMLEFSRRNESKLAPCDIRVVLEKALELAGNDYDLRKKFDFRRIRIVREFEEGLPPVRCTQTEMEQVLFNLVKNAAQALGGYHQDGTSPAVTLRLVRDGDFARIEVEDNGPGMPEAVRKRIFEPFFTTKSPGMGTGLGLSVTYFIVTRNHGGDISVESAPGHGARFVIRLPFLSPDEASCPLQA